MKIPGWLSHPYTHAAALLLSLLAALAVVAFMAGTFEYTKTRGKLLLTALLLAGYFLTMLIAAGIPREGVMRWLYAAVIALAALALFLLLLGLWATPDSGEFWKSAAIITSIALGLSLAGLAAGMGSSGWAARVLAWMSASLATLLTVMTALGIALAVKAAPYWWAFVLLALCWLAASIALAVGRLWRRRRSVG